VGKKAEPILFQVEDLNHRSRGQRPRTNAANLIRPAGHSILLPKYALEIDKKIFVGLTERRLGCPFRAKKKFASHGPRALPAATMVEPVGLANSLHATHPFADRFCEENQEHSSDGGHDHDLEILRRHLLNGVGVEVSCNKAGDEVPE
jgi:hypothetical protein